METLLRSMAGGDWYGDSGNRVPLVPVVPRQSLLDKLAMDLREDLVHLSRHRDAAALGHRAPDCGNPRVISGLAPAVRASHDVGERARDGR